MDEYESHNHTKWACECQMVFIPKYRRKALYGSLRKHLGSLFRELARHKEREIGEGHLMVDHLYMLISIPPKHSVSQVIVCPAHTAEEGLRADCDGYLTKPIDVQELTLRVGHAAHAKHLFDQLQAEQEKSAQLLLNILPRPIAERMRKGEVNIADQHPDVTVLLADLVGFTTLAAHIGPDQVVYLLNEIFSGFDGSRNLDIKGRRTELVHVLCSRLSTPSGFAT